MKKIIVSEFGEPDVLKVHEVETPIPGPGQVRVALTSIGVNYADIMARRGEYKIASGPCPFTPGLEGGGVIDAVGEGVDSRKTGDRVILTADAPRHSGNIPDLQAHGGTYRSHYIVAAEKTLLAPAHLPDNQLGALWLPYLTAWGCLVWKQNIKPGQFVGIPAASSSVGLAAAQIVKAEGAIPIGLTTSKEKIEELKKIPEAVFDHYVVTHDSDGHMQHWGRDVRKITRRHGIDIFFDPVAAGAYLEIEILNLAHDGVIWIYGLLGKPDKVDVTPLIRKAGSIRGWVLYELTASHLSETEKGYKYILDGFEKGTFRHKIAEVFPLEQAREAHKNLAKGKHIGKFVLVP